MSATATKTDLKKEYANLYNPSAKEVTVVDVPPLQYLMIDGAGNPNTAQEYKDAVEALYSVSYGLKFMLKKQGHDYTVMPLEGLWWTPDMRDFSVERKDDWLWTMMILQPEEVTVELFAQALEQAKSKKDNPALDKIRLETLEEKSAVQIMHHGPYADEGPTIERLHNYITENGYSLGGKHHEIYISDPRRVAPEKMKTVIRQPFVR